MVRITKLEAYGRFRTYLRSLNLCSRDPSEPHGPNTGEKREHWVELRRPGQVEHLLFYTMQPICNILFKTFDAGSSVAQVGLELATQLTITLNF